MRILITNDDGVDAPGIRALVDSIETPHDVSVIAPLSEQSGVGCTLNLDGDLQVEPRTIPRAGLAVGVAGSPVDCVKVALAHLLDHPPDLVISGVNAGANIGRNVFYSGTVAAALEAAFHGIPALAVSLASFDPRADYRPAASVAAGLIGFFEQSGFPPGHLLNVNVPDLPEEQLKGLRVTIHGRAHYQDLYRSGSNGLVHRLISDEMEGIGGGETDAGALKSGYISVTPMTTHLSAPLLAGLIQRWTVVNGGRG